MIRCNDPECDDAGTEHGHSTRLPAQPFLDGPDTYEAALRRLHASFRTWVEAAGILNPIDKALDFLTRRA